MPTFNRAAFLAGAIDSVLAQTVRDCEIIVCDDGSTDRTPEVLEAYHGRVRALRKPNGGVASARNLALAHATGRYVAFLDSDDVWLPHKLEVQLAYLEAHPDTELLSADYAVLPNAGADPSEVPKSVMFRGRPSFAELFEGNYIATTTVIARRAGLERVGLFDESLVRGSDYEMWLRVANEYPIDHLPGVVAHYRRHADSLTGPDLVKAYQAYLDATGCFLAKVPDTLDRLGMSKRAYWGNYYYHLGLALYSAGQLGLARRYLAAAITHGRHPGRALTLCLRSLLRPAPVEQPVRSAV